MVLHHKMPFTSDFQVRGPVKQDHPLLAFVKAFYTSFIGENRSYFYCFTLCTSEMQELNCDSSEYGNNDPPRPFHPPPKEKE